MSNKGKISFIREYSAAKRKACWGLLAGNRIKRLNVNELNNFLIAFFIIFEGLCLLVINVKFN